MTVPQGATWLLSGGCTFFWKCPGGLIHMSSHHGVPSARCFLSSEVSLPRLSLTSSLHTVPPAGQRDCLPFAAAPDSERTRRKPRGAATQSPRRESASLPQLSITARQRATPHSRGGATGSPCGRKERVTFQKGVRTGQDLGDRLWEQASREPQTYALGATPSTPGVGAGDARALPMPSASSKDRLHPSQRQG